jgi:hypothetical protein
MTAEASILKNRRDKNKKIKDSPQRAQRTPGRIRM